MSLASKLTTLRDRALTYGLAVKPPDACSPLPADQLALETVPCDLCGGTETRERYRKPDFRSWVSLYEFPVVECVRCGLVFVNPRPTPAGMAPFYEDGYHEGRDKKWHLKRYEAQLAFLPRLEEQSMLDIGCARGDFLSFVLDRHPRVKVVGVDAFSTGVQDPRIPFRRGALPDCQLDASSFDLVTAWAVFEHLHSPSRDFAEVFRILKPGGRFVFLVTNSESLASRHAFREDIPRHTYHFSPSTLSRYASKHGFEVSHITFDDTIFDGRGRGTFRWMLPRALGVTWPDVYRRQMSALQLGALFLGRAVDRVVFSTHWEARLRRSSIIVAELRKPSAA